MTKGWDFSTFGKSDFFHELMGGEGNELGRTTMEPLFDFIERNDDNPMYIWYGSMLPHTPHDTPYKYQKYNEHQDLSESAKLYYANISWWDDGVGQLMDFLESRGQLSNTLFVYISDNGWEQHADVEYKKEGSTIQNDPMFSNGGLKGKGGLYEQSFRTPVIFYWKDHIHASLDESSIVSMLDLVPTVLYIVGIDSSEALHGKSLSPLLNGEVMNLRTELVGYADQRRSMTEVMGQATEGYFLRINRWHFMWYVDTNEMELYDVTVDP